MDILVVDDEVSLRDTFLITLESEGYYVEGAEDEQCAMLAIKDQNFDLIFLDLKLGNSDGIEILANILTQKPNQLVVIITAYGSVDNAVKATKLGAFDYLSKPFSPDQIRAITVKAKREINNRKRISELTNEVEQLKSKINKYDFPTIFDSRDDCAKEVFDVLFKAAKSHASILILGESGTGKSMVAKQVHEKSKLAHKNFVTISCPSLSEELLESELFGHVKGAFTGATKDTWGKVKQAHGGTLFLDEIGELPLPIQAKLLRLLQEREYERVGETTTRKTNVRIIAATNQDLQKNVANRKFREDLYYRLNVITVNIPALRDRPNDLIVFASHYLEHFAKNIGHDKMQFSAKALDSIIRWSWPGNLRELRNTIERSTILSEGNIVESDSLPFAEEIEKLSSIAPVKVGNLISLEQLEGFHIQKVIENTKNLAEAAKVLDIDKATLYRKRKKLRINHARPKPQ